MTKEKTIEIARSFSRKVNLGHFQNADFFCSAKAEVSEKDAVKIAEELDKFVQDEVMKSVNTYRLENDLIEKKPIKPVKRLNWKDRNKGEEGKIDRAKEDGEAEKIREENRESMEEFTKLFPDEK